MGLTAAFLIFAALVTKLVDLTRNTVGKNVTQKWVWNVVAFAYGIGIALLYQQADVSQISGLPPILANQTGVGAEIIVGIALGASASGFHELFDALSGVAKRGQNG